MAGRSYRRAGPIGLLPTMSPQAHRRPAVVLRRRQRSLARTRAAASSASRRRQDVRVAGADGERRLDARAPENSFIRKGPYGTIRSPRGTLPDLLSQAAADYGARAGDRIPRPLPSATRAGKRWSRSRRRRSWRAGYGTNQSVALFLAIPPDHPANFFGALKAAPRVVHLSRSTANARCRIN